MQHIGLTPPSSSSSSLILQPLVVLEIPLPYTHNTRSDSSPFPGVWNACRVLFLGGSAGAESQRRWLYCVVVVGARLGRIGGTSSFAANPPPPPPPACKVMSHSVVESSLLFEEEQARRFDLPVPMMSVELIRGRPISWKELIELKPLSASLCIIIAVGCELRLPASIFPVFVACPICMSSGSVSITSGAFCDDDADEAPDELEDVEFVSQQLRMDVLLWRPVDLRQKDEFSDWFIKCGDGVGDEYVESKRLLGSASDGSCVFSKLLAVRNNRNASWDSFSGSMSMVDMVRFRGFRLRRLKGRDR